MKTNKEVIDSLVEYFLKQPPKIIARGLANAMVDIKRLYMFSECSNEEKKSLLFRTDQNIRALNKFIKDGPDGYLKFKHVVTIEDENV
jgi:hypothetical protein